jgi:protein phosphatase 1G
MKGWASQLNTAIICQKEISNGCSLFGVFDGHSGPEISRFVAKHFKDELEQNLNFTQMNFKQALEESFMAMDTMMQTPDG